MLKRFFTLSALAVLSVGVFALPQSAHAAVDGCDVAIDNDLTDWEDLDYLVNEEGDTTGVTYYWENEDSTEWTTTEPGSYLYRTNVQQMADLEKIKMCNDMTNAYLYGAAQNPFFGIYNTQTESWQEFRSPEDGSPAMPETFNYWMVYEMQKEGSSNVYYYGIHLVAEEGDYGMENGPAKQALYQDDGDGEFNPNADTELAEFQDSPENAPPEDSEEGKAFDQDGALEVALALVNSAGEGVFTETDISYGDTISLTAQMIANSQFSGSSTNFSPQVADEVTGLEYRMAKVSVDNVKVKKKKRKRKKATVSWTAESLADKYRVRLFNKKGTKKLRTVKTNKPKKVLKKLKPNRRYRVRVRAIMADGEVKSPWSNAVKFKTKKAKTE